MAGHGDTDGHANAHDFKAHERSYQSFMWWLKMGAVVSFVIAMIATVVIAS